MPFKILKLCMILFFIVTNTTPALATGHVPAPYVPLYMDQQLHNVYSKKQLRNLLANTKDEKYFPMDFYDISLENFIFYISEISGVRFQLPDENDDMNFILVTSGAVSGQEARDIFDAVLHVNGLEVLSEDSRIVHTANPFPPKICVNGYGKIVFYVYDLRYIVADQVLRKIGLMFPQNGDITALPLNHGRSLFLHGTEGKIEPLLKIIQILDGT